MSSEGGGRSEIELHSLRRRDAVECVLAFANFLPALLEDVINLLIAVRGIVVKEDESLDIPFGRDL